MRICFILLLVLIGWKDFQTRRIPDRLVLCLLVPGVFSACMALGAALQGVGAAGCEAVLKACAGVFAGRIAGLFAASLPLFVINLIRPGAFGGGDIKLLAAGGLYLGAENILQALGIGMVLAGLFCAVGLLVGHMERKSRFALGPFLCIGMIVRCFLM